MLIHGKPLVSIIIPVYNGSNYLKTAIESALAQTYDNIEIIIVNDGSDDSGKTERIACSFGDKVRYYHKENGGVATALNFAIQKMNGEYFSWLSHDDIFYAHKIEAEMEEIRRCGDKEKIVFCNRAVWEEQTGLVSEERLEERYSIRRLENSCFPLFMGVVPGCTLLFHRDHFDRVGLFKEELDTTQDYDLWFRLFRGQNTRFIPEALMMVRHHMEQGSRVKKHYRSEQDQLYLGFMEQWTDEENIQVFGSRYQFYCETIGKYRRWGLPQAYQKAREELLRLELPPDSGEKLEELGAAIRGSFPAPCEEIFLFGAGRIGRWLQFELHLRRIEIKGFIDNDAGKHGKQVDGLICSPLSEVSRDAGIIVAIKENREKIALQLEEAGYRNIIPGYSELERLLSTAPIDISCLEETD